MQRPPAGFCRLETMSRLMPVNWVWECSAPLEIKNKASVGWCSCSAALIKCSERQIWILGNTAKAPNIHKPSSRRAWRPTMSHQLWLYQLFPSSFFFKSKMNESEQNLIFSSSEKNTGSYLTHVEQTWESGGIISFLYKHQNHKLLRHSLPVIH